MILKKLPASEGIAAVIVMLAVALVFPVQSFSAPPSKTHSVYEKALSAYSRGDYGKAERLLKKDVKERPVAPSYYLLGYASYKLGHRRAAKRYFSDAYLIDPRLNPKDIGKEFQKAMGTGRRCGTRK